MPFFSVVIPTFNRAARLSVAIDSVLSQTFRNWELIIVDDASTDNTRMLLDSIDDPRVKVLRNEHNVERSASRNRGIRASSGRYIAFLDSDDYFRTGHLETLAQAIEIAGQPVAAFFTDCERYDATTGRRRIVQVEIDSHRPVEQLIAKQVPCISVAIHRKILYQYLFDEGLIINEDVDLFARIASTHAFRRVAACTVVAVTHGSNTRGVVKDAMRVEQRTVDRIFARSELREHISDTFKRTYRAELAARAATYALGDRRRFLAARYACTSLAHAWLGARSRVMIGAVCYAMPGGAVLRRVIKTARTASARLRKAGRV